MALFSSRGTHEYVLADITSDVDIASCEQFERFLRSIAQSAGSRAVIVNLTPCHFMDSTGLAALVRQHARTPNLVVVLPKDHTLQRIFTLTKMGDVFTVAESCAEAIARAQGAEREAATAF
jgi:anti-anti-sigma factor